MKVLFLTKYTDLGASSRMRTYQYIQFYKEAGIECTVEPFFNDDYLRKLYAGKRNKLTLFLFYFKRFYVLCAAFKYDKIYIEKEIFPYLPAFAEYFLSVLKKKYIVDYDDAIFHNYDKNANVVLRKFLGNKIDQVMKYAEVVIAGNTYLAERAAKAGAKRIVIIPTVVDLRRYDQVNKKFENKEIAQNGEDRVVVGWIGTKSTFEKHLLFIKDWLIKAQKIYDIELHIIGINVNTASLGDHVKLIPWSEDTEVENISNFDIGIMPLQNTSWEEGKCAYKIIQYLACGKPVIASNVGMNSQLCINGKTGYLADSEEEFLAALDLLIHDQELRREMGKTGRKLIEDQYDLQITSEKLVKVMSEPFEK